MYKRALPCRRAWKSRSAYLRARITSSHALSSIWKRARARVSSDYRGMKRSRRRFSRDTAERETDKSRTRHVFLRERARSGAGWMISSYDGANMRRASERARLLAKTSSYIAIVRYLAPQGPSRLARLSDLDSFVVRGNVRDRRWIRRRHRERVRRGLAEQCYWDSQSVGSIYRYRHVGRRRWILRFGNAS